MATPQRLPASLTPPELALAAVLDRLAPVAPIELPLAEARRCIAADMPPLKARRVLGYAPRHGWRR